MKNDYREFLYKSIPKSAEVYFKEIGKLEQKFKIENIFSLKEDEFDAIFSKKKISALSKNEKSYLNKFKAFKNFQIENIKSIKKHRTELDAIIFVTEYFQSEKYIIESFESENLGYDLQAKRGKEIITIEVKGISSNKSVILTENEISYMNKNKENHKICVVLNVHKKPQLVIFNFNPKLNKWESSNNKTLIFHKHLSSQFKIE